MDVDYAGMHAGVLAAWLLIATASGYLARRSLNGRSIFGLWGDAAIGLIGIFVVGTTMRAFNFDLSVWLHSLAPEGQFALAIWVDIAVTSLIGSFLFRAILRPFKGLRG